MYGTHTYIHDIYIWHIYIFIWYAHTHTYIYVMLSTTHPCVHNSYATVHLVMPTWHSGSTGLEPAWSDSLEWQQVRAQQTKDALQQQRQQTAVNLFMVAEQWSWKHPGELQTNNDKKHLGSSPTQHRPRVQQQRRGNKFNNKLRMKENKRAWSQLKSVGDPQQEEMATGHDIGTPTATDEEATEALASTNLKPPTFDGNYSTFEEWKYKFKAYMGIQDNIYPDLLARAERATTVLTDAELIAAAGTPEEAERWIQLANNLKYILISTTSAAAATVCRHHQAAMGLEVYRQLCQRFSIPLGTRSIGYLTKLLKPTFNHNNFEESFSTWEFEVDRYERDNNTQLPDQVKIAVLMNETTGPLQQHLHLNAGQAPTYPMIREIITEYYRTTTAFARLQQQASSSVSTNHNGGPAPMDISATYKGKGGRGKGNKGYKGKQQSKG